MVGARLQLYALVALAFVAGLLGLYWSGVQRGIQQQRTKIDRQRLDQINRAKEIEDEINADPDIVSRAARWVRRDD
jgi:UDP-N-acetylmuramyl pentapeptide synthase